MGSFDCYCAICGATLKAMDAPVGVRSQLRGDDGDSGTQNENGSDSEDHSGHHVGEADEDTLWLSDVRCLGVNPGPEGGPAAAFISGRAEYDDYGFIQVSSAIDTNHPSEDNYHPCFWSSADDADDESDGEPSVVFPFHNRCYMLLNLLITGDESISITIDKNALYDAMKSVSERYASTLAIDQGIICGGGQFWETIPGEEYTVVYPIFDTAAKDSLRQKLSGSTFRQTNQYPAVSKSRQNQFVDPFLKLPTETLWQIAQHLSIQDLRELLFASWGMLNATRNNSFWRAYMAFGFSWAAQDVQTILKEIQSQEDLDFSQFYLYFERVTRPEPGVEPLWMGLANRRRIWGACQDLKVLYEGQIRTKND